MLDPQDVDYRMPPRARLAVEVVVDRDEIVRLPQTTRFTSWLRSGSRAMLSPASSPAWHRASRRVGVMR